MTRKPLFGLCAAAVLLTGALTASADTMTFVPSIQAEFSPGSAEETVINLVRQANKSVRILTTSMVNKNLADEIVLAHIRGVDVRVLFTRAARDQRSFVVAFLQNSGVNATYASSRINVNSNFMVIDENTIQAGSLDYSSESLRRNHETVLIVRNHPDTAFRMLSAWQQLAEDAEPIAPTRSR